MFSRLAKRMGPRRNVPQSPCFCWPRRFCLILLTFCLPLFATTPTNNGMPSIQFFVIVGAAFLLILFFGLLIWNRNSQKAAQFRTRELLLQLTESNAQTRDLQSQLSERKQTEEMLLRRGDLRKIIANLSSDFVRFGPNEIEDGINRALAVIGEFSSVARSYVFLLRADGDTIDNTHEWCAEGVTSYINELQGISLDRDLPWLGERLKDFREINIGSVSDLPSPAKKEREHLQKQNINSLFCVPMVSANQLRGFLGFDCEKDHFYWAEDLIQLLRIVGEIFTHALDRQRAEITLRESEERFRELADLLPQTIFETDLRMRITYFNRQGLRLTGYADEDLVEGLDGLSLFPPSERESVFRDMNHPEEKSDLTHGREYVCLRKDGSSFPALIYSMPIVQNGKPFGVRGIIIDISQRKKEDEERRRLEAQFLQAQKFESLSVMAGSIAHNFNNLLTVALGNLEMALQDEPAGLGADYLRESERAIKRAAELSSLMLTYVGKNRMAMVFSELSSLVQDVVVLIESNLKRRVPLHVDLQSGMFKGDSAQVKQVVANLINNASESLIEGQGEIWISTGTTHYVPSHVSDALNQEMCEGDYVFVEVRDNGIGMDKQTVDRVFDPFFTTKFTGRGLGLAAVLGIVRAHKGGITVNSVLGSGTSVRVLLPDASKQGVILVPDGDASLQPTPRGCGTILLVDDEEMVLSVGERMLARLGFKVLTAKDGVDAVEVYLANRDEVRCVLLDLTMPRMDGEETFLALRSHDPSLCIVLASGHSEEELASRFANHKPDAFIRKPFRMKGLGEVLAAAMNGALEAQAKR